MTGLKRDCEQSSIGTCAPIFGSEGSGHYNIN